MNGAQEQAKETGSETAEARWEKQKAENRKLKYGLRNRGNKAAMGPRIGFGFFIFWFRK